MWSLCTMVTLPAVVEAVASVCSGIRKGGDLSISFLRPFGRRRKKFGKLLLLWANRLFVRFTSCIQKSICSAEFSVLLLWSNWIGDIWQSVQMCVHYKYRYRYGRRKTNMFRTVSLNIKRRGVLGVFFFLYRLLVSGKYSILNKIGIQKAFPEAM